MAVPMAWPTYSRTTENPAASATVCTAWPMSVSRWPSSIWSMAAQRARSVTSISRCASFETSPMAMVKAASPWYPSTIAPQSIDRMSPSANRYSPGMPCTIMPFGDVQITAGNPW